MTLIFYIGNSSTSPFQLYEDITEITKQHKDISNKKVIMLYDGPESGDTKLLHLDTVFGNTSREIKLSDTNIRSNGLNELDMADPDTLSDYITYVKDKIPSKYYTLYFGAHGNGFRKTQNAGLEVEKSSNTNEKMLEITEINQALINAGGVDLAVFDVCLIGNLENIYELKDSVKYIIASPETIPGDGNNYEYLIDSYYSETEPTPYNLGMATLNSYYSHYNELNSQTQSTYFKDKELISMFDVLAIKNIIEKDGFDAEITSYIKTTYIQYKFGLNNSYSLLSNEDILDCITTTQGDNKKLISIYYPSINNFNDNYKDTSFSKLLPEWTTYLETRN